MRPQLHNTILCMDARMLAQNGGTGVSTYARALERVHAEISQNRALLSDRKKLDEALPVIAGRPGRWLRALWPAPRKAQRLPPRDGSAVLFVNDAFRLAQVYFDVHNRPLPVRVPGPPGIMHWTYPVPLVLLGWRNLYTVHDTIPLAHPELTPIDRKRYQRLLNQLGKSAASLITVSNAARDQILGSLRCAPSFVVNCGLAVETDPVDQSVLPGRLTQGGYMLVCGTVEIRKNIASVLTAYNRSGIALPLVIAGPDGWGGHDISTMIAETPGAIRLPYLHRNVIRTLIHNARALIMPSLAEGFGLPVAEAMALGTPVVTSNRGALAETAGDAALTIDPLDVTALAAALRRLAGDEALCQALVAAGRRNALRFMPERFAERLAQVYNAAMADSS